MKVINGTENGKPSLEFRDFEEKDGEMDVVSHFDKIFESCNTAGIEITGKHLLDSINDWECDLKSSIKLPNGYNLYHACGCNPLYFWIFYDPEYPEYKS